MKMLLSMACVTMVMAACVPASARDTSHAPETRIHEAEVLVAWNERVLALAVAEDRLLTLKGVRTAAMMHIAAHDALNSIRPRYSTYAFGTRAAGGADPVVAVAQAAYEVVVAEYPAQEPILRAELERWTANARNEHARKIATVLGKSAAAAILKKRQGDEWNAEVSYVWHPVAPGVYAEFRDHSGTPEFSSFSDAAMECAMSRVYLGIHFRYDSIAGNSLGVRIGEYSAKRYLRPAR